MIWLDVSTVDANLGNKYLLAQPCLEQFTLFLSFKVFLSMIRIFCWYFYPVSIDLSLVSILSNSELVIEVQKLNCIVYLFSYYTF